MTKLEQATALLEMFRDCCADEPRESLRAFLDSNDPAQPVAPEPDHVNGCAWFVGGPCTRDCDFAATGTPEHEPAAPEPSAEFQRGYKEGGDDTARELIGNHERDNKLADAVQQAAALVDWHARAESAEAKLAAVRSIVGTDEDDQADDAKVLRLVAEATLVTTPKNESHELIRQLRAAHAETRKALEEAKKALDYACLFPVHAERVKELADLESTRAELARSEARVKELEREVATWSRIYG